MDKQRRKELREEFKQVKTYMGIAQITNTINGKIYIAAYRNLKNRWLTIKGQLTMGMHVNSQLQKDWLEQRPEDFTYEVLEEKESADVTDIKWELQKMEKPWLEKLQPYGEKGYNKPPR
jgi:hypothetical protein